MQHLEGTSSRSVHRSPQSTCTSPPCPTPTSAFPSLTTSCVNPPDSGASTAWPCRSAEVDDVEASVGAAALAFELEEMKVEELEPPVLVVVLMLSRIEVGGWGRMRRSWCSMGV